MADNKHNIVIETHFEQVHSIIHLHRSRALKVVNNESLLICWNVGQYVSEKLNKTQWGSKVVTQLSEYLRTKDPSLKDIAVETFIIWLLFSRAILRRSLHNFYHH